MTSVSSFATCDILVHKDVTRRSIGSLIEYKMEHKVLENTDFTNYSKTPDFGMKENSTLVSTGAQDIFGEDIMKTVTSFSLYEDGRSIFTTSNSSDYKILMKEFVQKLIDLKCD
jgi:hypothetical protein